MSRLIVKNLPIYITDKRIKDHFASQGGNITDVKLVHRPDGTSRRFAFVGFKTDAEALKAKEYFDRSYIDSSRINVLIVDPNRDSERPAKRQRLSPPTESSQTTVKKDTTAKRNDDPALTEFLQVMQPRNKKDRSWANEDLAIVQPVAATDSIPVSMTPSKDAKRNKNSADKKASPPPETSEVEYFHSDTVEGVDEAVSDLEWMRRRMKDQVLDEPTADSAPPEFTQDDEEGTENTESIKPSVSIDVDLSVAAPKIDDPFSTTTRLYIQNIAYACTLADLEHAFGIHGEVTQAHIPVDSITKAPKGFAFVTYASSQNARAAYSAMDKSTFQGRIIHVSPAVDRRTAPEDPGKKSLKQTRLQNAKETAGRDFNWSMLYMNSDAVVSSVADRMKLSKSDILNPDSSDAAVKLALAETHVIQETKKYLEEQGVVLDSFKSRTRSETTILVKNIPYGTSTDELSEMFSPHGEIVRLLLPPAGTMAVVEFSHSSEAQKAFRAVAYRRLKNSIIYLEKAPAGIFVENDDHPRGTKYVSSGVKPVAAPAGAVAIQDTQATGSADDGAGTSGTGATLFVKNLSFSTTSEKLVKTFRQLASFSFARVQTKPDPKRPGSTLSMGYGFVGFKDKDAAMKAMKTMQGFVLDGHSLLVKFAQRGADEVESQTAKTSGVGKSMTTKMIVKNLPFEVTKKELHSLFSAHGQLKSVRLPRKFDAGSRGFAFLDFISRHEAENAYDALKHTHILGRHIVLEWAEDSGTGADVEMLRQRVKAGYGDGKSEMPGKKRKLDMDVLGQEDGEEGEDFVAV